MVRFELTDQAVENVALHWGDKPAFRSVPDPKHPDHRFWIGWDQMSIALDNDGVTLLFTFDGKKVATISTKVHITHGDTLTIESKDLVGYIRGRFE